MLKFPNIMIIGLTGMSGAGKSTVCGAFGERGFSIIDCDAISRKTADDPLFLAEIGKRFPKRLLDPDGGLDRAAAAELIYNDEAQRERYQRTIFPYIIYGIAREIKSAGENVLLDAPTLFESGLDMACDKIVSVVADERICLERIIKRDGIDLKQARERISSQHGADFFRSRSDYCIENNGGAEELRESARKIIDKLKG